TGTSLYSIKNYIQDAYDNWENPPEFICLVGDAGVPSLNIPTGHMSGAEGDQYYVLLEGNDILADAFIGRLSFNTIYQLQTIIFKILHYEKEPYLDETDWYNRALLVGDPSDSGPSAVDTKMHIKEMIDEHAGNIICDEVYSGPWVSQMANGINNGVSYFNYRGFYGMSGWGNSNIDALNNGYMLPVAVFMTCGVGSYEGTYDCRSERFLKAGSPGNPKGAIGAIATAGIQTHTCFNNCVDAGVYYGIFADKIYHLGGALNRGKLNIYINYPNNPMNAVYNFSYWNNLMGDPGMEIWTGIPQEMTVTYNSQISLGSNYIEITVGNILGFPVENAWVTALMGNDEIFSTGLTDSIGKILLPIDAENTGNVNLTVTKHDFIPHLGSFDIVQFDVFVNVFEVEIDDDAAGTSSGNGNGILNPGEDIELNVSLKNYGTQTANSVSAVITSESEFITITDDTEDYGDIASGSSAYPSDDFDFSISPDALGGAEIEFDILIEDGSGNEWNDKIHLIVEGANLYASEYTVMDGGEGILDPGETAELVLTIENIGSVEASDVYGILMCNNNMITIEDSLGYFGSIPAGGQATNNTNRFELTANTQIIPGTQYFLYLYLYNTDGYDNTSNFIFEVGEVTVTDPLGPDEYGYYCYDDGDTDYYNVPVYQWVEIDPTYGGPGTTIYLYDYGDMGDIEDIDLPFVFKFYGNDYTSITICSNGWISPGHTEIESFMNWSVPGPLGPSPIIAPFWDDLRIGSGHVCYYYDASSHYFVVEWSHLQNDYNGAQETFQVILYDSNFYPTTTGDSEIVFQYKTINNVDQGQYGGFYVYHGEYATVGLEDHTGTVGLEYTYSNQYPTAAKVLENEMALLFTGPPIPYEEAYIVLGGLDINDANGNGLVDYAEDVNLDIALNNLGETTATGVYAILSSSDDYITITVDSSDYNDIPAEGSEVNIVDYSFSVDENCPDGHIVSFQLIVVSSNESWNLDFILEVNAPEIEYNSLFVDDGDNNILDPGETANILVSFINNGGADAYSVVSNIATNDIYLSFNSTFFNFGTFPADAIQTATFNVTADSDAPIGHCAIIIWEITADYSYSNEGNIFLSISQVPVLVTEEFNTFPPPGWVTTSSSGQINWGGSNSNEAGGSAPEAEFYWSPSTFAVQRLISPSINTLGHTELDLEFKHYISHYSGTYILRVETTSDGNNWNEVITFPAANMPATTENLTITTSDIGSETFQLAFTFDGDSYNINNWNIDDVIIGGGTPPVLGYIAGNVTLNGGTGSVEDVQVTAGSYLAHPDSIGDYIIAVAASTYDVTASLTDYEPETVTNVVVVELDTTFIDFTLNQINMPDPPQNLTATVNNFNDVTLEWNMPNGCDGSRFNSYKTNQDYIIASSKRKTISSKSIFMEKSNTILRTINRDLTGYKVYRNEEMIQEITNPTDTTYAESLDEGEYTYYVTAIYDNTNESEPSNQDTVEIILPPPTDLTYTYNEPDVELTWLAPALDRSLTGYKIYRNEEVIGETTDTSFVDENIPAGTHLYYVTALYGDYESDPSNEVEFTITDINNPILPLKTALSGNYPNPFNPDIIGKTTISFSLAKESQVRVEIYNVQGQKVKTLIDENKNPGNYYVIWNGKDEADKTVSSGIYFCKLKANDNVFIKKMIILR
ncbi:MAG: T9SS type A sorting domain-containing protein, partial [Candidatus Cloacimonetes bacterium]|nr:T9SS type A sorting domain-containing protein [Candidatus Cloacimonadota bacterium]